MSVSIYDLDLRQVPFSRRLSRMMVLIGPENPAAGGENALFLAYTNSVSTPSTRYNLIQIEPTLNGEAIPYACKADPGKLTVTAGPGTVELCYDGFELLRIRSRGGLGLRFYLRFEMHEQFMDRLDGTVYSAYGTIGEFLFEATKGTQTHNGKWNAPAMRPENTEIKWAPAADGALEGYINFAEYAVNRPAELHDFDSCVNENRADFEDWCKKYAAVPEKYADVRLLAIYAIWICYVAPRGAVKDNMVYMMRNGILMRAMGWQQSYQAMAVWKDIDVSVRLLHSMFTAQDEYGQLPDSVSDKYVTMLATKPPFQGFALSYILDRVGIDALTEEHCQMLYMPMCKWANWWLTFRDRDGDGLVAYVHGDESGWDDSSIFSQGIPVMTPDIAAFLVLLMEACGKLAARLGKQHESEDWLDSSSAMLDRMIAAFWNGEKFEGILCETREAVDQESIALYQPIILGKRLPDYIIDKIADALGDPERFFTPRGFVSESLKSEYYNIDGPFMLGMILAPVQLMITVGLYNAGKKELALKNAYNWCEQMLEIGPQTIIRDTAPKAPAKDDGAKRVLPASSAPGGLGSWGAAVFLILGSLLSDESAERSE